MPVVPRARFPRALLAFALLAAAAPRARAACTGPGAAAAFAAGTSPQAVVAADFNGDGIPDLGLACLTGAPLVVLAGNAAGGYGAPVAYAGGTAGRALAAGDFNADGRTDLAVAVADGVRVWLGAGDGTFTAGAAIVAGSANRGVVCADFDGDGILDLALASSATNAVLVLPGTGASGAGDGGFGSPATCPVGASPARLAAADFDGDGILDLAVANNGSASVSILRGRGADGRGDGSFSPAFAVVAPGSPWGVAVVDGDHDGVPDLLVSNGAGTTVSFLRGASGSFVPAGTVTTATAPRDLVAGDFDGDGLVDVATACAAGNVLQVLRGTGSGFAPFGSWASGSGATGIAAADVNRDGAPDLLVANTGGGSVTRFLAGCPAAPGAQVTLLEPLGGESWWPGTVPRVRWARAGGVAAVDVDLSFDGGTSWRALARASTDGAIAAPTTGVPGRRLRARVRDALVPVRAATSPGEFTLCGILDSARVSDVGFLAAHLLHADVDGDGRADLLAADDQHLAVLRGDGDGHFAPGASVAGGPTLRLRMGDVTGDGIVDGIRLAPDAVVVHAGDGTGGFGAGVARPLPGGTDVVTGDFDGDGIDDIAALAASGAGGLLLVWRSATPGTPWSSPLPGPPGALATGDFDRDGIADLALVSGNAIEVRLGEGAGGRGDGTFRAGLARTLPATPGDLAVLDTDGDGTPDLLACVPATGDVWRIAVTPPAPGAAGVVGLGAPQAAGAGAPPRSPRATDFDGDGFADLVVSLEGPSAVAVLRGTKDGFAPPARFAAGAAAGGIAIDDFTGDGLPDVVVAGADGRVRCLPAQCPPRNPATVTLSDPADTSAALAGFARRISWRRSPALPAVRVELTRDGGAHWTALADGLPGEDLAWAVSGPATEAARLRVSDASCATRFDESRPFAIREPFETPRASAAGAGAVDLALADLDGDGASDAAVADGNGITLARSDGDGGWSVTQAWPEPGLVRVRLADLDGDGAADLLALHADSLCVRRGGGDGTFGPACAVAIERGARDLAIGDLDEDGLPDLAIAFGNAWGNGLALLAGRGLRSDVSLGFAPARLVGLPSPPREVVAADLDADGILDLVVLHATGLRALHGNGVAGRGDGTFRAVSERAFAGASRALLVADLDGDGMPDAAAADIAGQLVTAAGDGHGTFGTPAVVATGASPLALLAADFDRDGAADLALSLQDGGLLLLRGVKGAPLAGRFAPAWRSDGAGGPLVLADTDGDGVADAVALDPQGTLRSRTGRASRLAAPALEGPVPGAWVAPGTELPLRWTAPQGMGPLELQLSRDGGGAWSTVARGLAEGAWAWTASGPATPAARLRLADPAVPARPGPALAIAIGVPVTDAGATAPRTPRFARGSANPADGAAAFVLELPHAGDARVEVTDVAGRRVRVLAGGPFAAGRHALRWNGADERGVPAPAGLYFVRARAAGLDAVLRVALVR